MVHPSLFVLLHELIIFFAVKFLLLYSVIMVNSTPNSSSSSPTYTPEPSNPLFLFPSGVPGVSLVVVPFQGLVLGVGEV